MGAQASAWFKPPFETIGYWPLPRKFSPMILFGIDYLTKTYPVVGILRKLFAAQFARYVLVADTVDATAGLIGQFSPNAG